MAVNNNGGKTVAIIQSSYIPWKGYFDIIDQSDSFILLDDVQYTKRDWRSRNKIPTPHGEKWLTIPVKVKGKYHQRICDVEISSEDWYKSHWGLIENAYRKAPHYKENINFVKDLYMSARQNKLSDVNLHFLSSICNWLGINTPISWSMEYGIEQEDATERLVQLCLAAQATTYLSGPAARAYLDQEKFAERGINVRYFDYGHYQPYPQLHNGFTHFVSILDMIFMCGTETIDLIRQNRISASI